MRSSADALGRERNDKTSRRVECRRLEGSESDGKGGWRAFASELNGSDKDESWEVTGRKSTRLSCALVFYYLGTDPRREGAGGKV